MEAPYVLEVTEREKHVAKNVIQWNIALKRKEMNNGLRKRRMIVHEISDKQHFLSISNGGVRTSLSTDDSNEEGSNCVCGNDLDSMEDPICTACAADLKSFLK